MLSRKFCIQSKIKIMTSIFLSSMILNALYGVNSVQSAPSRDRNLSPGVSKVGKNLKKSIRSQSCNLNTSKITVTFEDLILAPNSFYNGSDGAGGFTSKCTFFNNSYNSEFQSWSGWSYSNTTDTTTPGFENQYSAYTGIGANSSHNYGVAFTFNPGDAMITIPHGFHIKSLRVTNTTYAALSMQNGDQFAKKFGGVSGNDPDFFLLTITGLNDAGEVVGTKSFYLADYRFKNNSKDYIVNVWTPVNLASFYNATKLSFKLTSSDNDPEFGLNTPAYFAIDNLVLSR